MNEIDWKDERAGRDDLYAVLATGASVVNAATGALMTRSAANWPTADIALSDTAAAYHYLAGVPAGTPAGRYRVTLYRRIGATPDLSDEAIGGGEIDWGGTAEVTNVAISSAVAAVGVVRNVTIVQS